MERGRHGIRLTRGAEEVPESPLENERQAEGQQQSIQMVELIEPLQEKPLDDDSGYADDERREHNRPPIPQARVLQQKIGSEGAQHVLRAMGEVDDVEHAEDDGKPEAEQRIERAVDEPDEQLPEQGLRADAEQFEHRFSLLLGRVRLASSSPAPVRAFLATRRVEPAQPVTSGQPPSLSGRNASAAGMVARSLYKSHGPFDSSGFFTSNRYMSWILRPSARTVPLPNSWSSVGISFILATTALPSASLLRSETALR